MMDDDDDHDRGMHGGWYHDCGCMGCSMMDDDDGQRQGHRGTGGARPTGRYMDDDDWGMPVGVCLCRGGMVVDRLSQYRGVAMPSPDSLRAVQGCPV